MRRNFYYIIKLLYWVCSHRTLAVSPNSSSLYFYLMGEILFGKRDDLKCFVLDLLFKLFKVEKRRPCWRINVRLFLSAAVVQNSLWRAGKKVVSVSGRCSSSYCCSLALCRVAGNCGLLARNNMWFYLSNSLLMDYLHFYCCKTTCDLRRSFRSATTSNNRTIIKPTFNLNWPFFGGGFLWKGVVYVTKI